MRSLRRFFTRWQNWIGLLLVAGFVFVALAAPLLSPQDPKSPEGVQVVGSRRTLEPQPPSSDVPLGTLPHSVSVYHSLVWGARNALVFGLIVTAISLLVGVLVGATSAYFGGFLNSLLMRITDAFLAFPMIAGVVLIGQLFTILINGVSALYSPLASTPMLFPGGTPGVPQLGEQTLQHVPYLLVFLQLVNPVAIAFILFSWMPYARIMNTVVTSIKSTEYVQSARVIGARPFRIIFRHLLPNAITPAIVLAARDIGGVVLLQATFTFIGMGGNSPWGTVLAQGRDWIISPGGILRYWWVFLPATLAIILFGIGWNLIGDGLNDALNPHSI